MPLFGTEVFSSRSLFSRRAGIAFFASAFGGGVCRIAFPFFGLQFPPLFMHLFEMGFVGPEKIVRSLVVAEEVERVVGCGVEGRLQGGG